MTTTQFANLIMQVERAKAKYDASPTDANFKRWNELAKEYAKQLRIRQDAKAGRS